MAGSSTLYTVVVYVSLCVFCVWPVDSVYESQLDLEYFEP